ncbi:MAG: hypothetical protein HY801_08415 [Candidatus Lindowbacteria bacterium]|nr:hypothetical protein [Candidatus Lindowbacteria bacterium]
MGHLVESFDRLVENQHGSILRCQSSENLSFVPDQSVDVVITDPPYFDNVQYSELADFFYVWLRLALKDKYPWFTPSLSSRPDEIVQNDKLGKTTEVFQKGLSAVLSECNRVLKDEGMLVFTFHHNKLWAWKSIGETLLESGFYVSASPIVRSEGKSGFHSSEGNIRYDCILVCRKRSDERSEIKWSDLKMRILTDAIYWTKRTMASGMPVTKADVFTILMGKTLEHCTKSVPLTTHGGKSVGLSEALDDVRELSERVAEDGQIDGMSLPKRSAKKIEQLSLFVMESRAKYGNNNSP